MRALDRKLLRDILRMKGQVLAICVLIACGVGSFVTSNSTWYSLGASQSSYYDRFAFADVFASLVRAPESVRASLQEIPGVAYVQTRVVADLSVDVPAMDAAVVGRLISLPPSGEPRLNKVYLRSGRMLDPHAHDEVLLIESFANAHRYQPGDALTVVMNGRRQVLRIVGIALSPEYVYTIRPGDLMPDDKRFAVMWMNRDAIAAAYDMDGAFNDVTISLVHGGSQKAVIESADRILAPYGALGAYGRYDQVSNRYLSEEIKQLRSTGLITPMVFLAIAAFLLNVMLTRLISTQREQIAALKALGYSNAAVGLHYVGLVLLVSLLGVAGGVALGGWLGRSLTQMYTSFFRFPALSYHLTGDVIVQAAATSVLAALLGVFGAVRAAVRLPPAEAMRPAAPPKYDASLLDRLGVHRLLSPVGRMIVRNLARRPVRSALSSFGIALAMSNLVVGWFFQDSMKYIMDVQFAFAQREDVTVTFNQAVADRAVRELEHLPGVTRAEAFRAAPVVLRAGHRSYRTAVLGLRPDAQLRRLLDTELHPHAVPQSGLVLTDELAEMLGARPGDWLVVEGLEGARPVGRMRLAGVLSEPVGVSAYASMEQLNAFLREGPRVSGAWLSVEPGRMTELFRAAKSIPRIAGVTDHGAMVQAFETTTKEYLWGFSVTLVAFACVIIVGVVYNSGRIALAERERELASLRVIGFTRGEVSLVLLGELGAQVLLSLPVGMGLGSTLAYVLAHMFDSELYRIPVVIAPATYGWSVVVVLAASAATALIVRSRIDKLDLVSVLKTKE